LQQPDLAPSAARPGLGQRKQGWWLGAGKDFELDYTVQFTFCPVRGSSPVVPVLQSLSRQLVDIMFLRCVGIMPFAMSLVHMRH